MARTKKQEDLLSEYRIISKSIITITYASNAFLKNARHAFEQPHLRTNQHEIGELFLSDITSAHNELITYLALHNELDPNFKMPIDEDKHNLLIESVHKVQNLLSFFCSLSMVDGFNYLNAKNLCDELSEQINDRYDSAIKELKKYHKN
ncbi:hypothetical protein SAMN06297229_2290 [Pseudidiomarina planktonica]|uniref:Uncharacterized protein n=1 Tax=Pseudidiomarina planktonica TaxID=1323738 RepID=A0A1Y6G4H0_9GAMM|nr:hypothetical protein [Pseudidiomarina planktonica]SMQ80534.1 hypothetical protein SAMN06297229_2290 [Pseudidiomarina planktonica]